MKALTWMENGYGFNLTWNAVMQMPYSFFLAYCGWYDEQAQRLRDEAKKIKAGK